MVRLVLCIFVSPRTRPVTSPLVLALVLRRCGGSIRPSPVWRSDRRERQYLLGRCSDVVRLPDAQQLHAALLGDRCRTPRQGWSHPSRKDEYGGIRHGVSPCPFLLPVPSFVSRCPGLSRCDLRLCLNQRRRCPVVSWSDQKCLEGGTAPSFEQRRGRGCFLASSVRERRPWRR